MKKKYDVYGIGNALVDLEFNVKDDFLHKHEVKKGLMTLVDEDKQEQLMDAIDDSVNVVKSGGSAGNTVIAINQFGGQSFFSCKVANDDFGHIYLREMDNLGVHTNFIDQEREEGVTGRCLVFTTEDSERTMNTFLGITTGFSVKEVDEKALRNSEYLYQEGYLVTSPTALEAMHYTKYIAEKQGVKTSITLSDPSVVNAFRTEFLDVIGDGVDLLFCNEKEARVFTESSSVEDAVEGLKKYARQFAVTLGAKGSILYDGNSTIEIKPHEVKAVDALGAGDMYAGAFLYGITNGHDFRRAGEFASVAASRVVSKYGPRLEDEEAYMIKEDFDKK